MTISSLEKVSLTVDHQMAVQDSNGQIYFGQTHEGVPGVLTLLDPYYHQLEADPEDPSGSVSLLVDSRKPEQTRTLRNLDPSRLTLDPHDTWLVATLNPETPIQTLDVQVDIASSAAPIYLLEVANDTWLRGASFWSRLITGDHLGLVKRIPIQTPRGTYSLDIFKDTEIEFVLDCLKRNRFTAKPRL